VSYLGQEHDDHRDDTDLGAEAYTFIPAGFELPAGLV